MMSNSPVVAAAFDISTRSSTEAANNSSVKKDEKSTLGEETKVEEPEEINFREMLTGYEIYFKF